MKKMIFAIALCLACACSCTEKPVVLPTEKGPAGWYIDPYLDDMYVQVHENAPGLDTQKYFEFLLEASELGWDQKYINEILRNATEQQVRTPGHPYYGQIPRYAFGETESSGFDRNNVCFAMEFATLLKILYYDTLSDENKVLLDDFIDYALYAVLDHDDVAVTYTNIYVMRVWILIGCGENLESGRTWAREKALTPEQIAQAGYDLFDAWLDEINYNGIHEHNSPTYTGVQAECIGYTAKYCKNPQYKALAEQALEYFSQMLMANYWEKGLTCVGPQSRCYYKGTSGGKIDNLATGLIKGYNTYFFNTLARWELSAKAKEINATYPRLVCYKWGADANMNSISYITEKYTIGTTGRPYTGNANEKTFVAYMAGKNNKKMLNIVHYLEGREDPYGKKPVSGSLSRHLQRYALGRSQRDNEFVALVMGDGVERGDTKFLQSHVLIPATNVDEMYVGDKKIANPLAISSEDLQAKDNYTFFLRFEDIVFSLRYLLVQDVDGHAVTPRLIRDTDGTSSFMCGLSKATAMRISAKLSSSLPAKWSKGTVVMWWRMDDGITTDEQFAALRESVKNAPAQVAINGNNVSVNVTTPDGDLGFKGDYIQFKYISAVTNSQIAQDKASTTLFWAFNQTETIGGTDPQNYFFNINGSDMFTPGFISK